MTAERTDRELLEAAKLVLNLWEADCDLDQAMQRLESAVDAAAMAEGGEE